MLGSFLFLYKFLPLYLATRLGKIYPAFSGRVASNLADGVIRIGIFLFFMVLISRMKDIRRVFEFHGAEHKVVFNFESGRPVTVENAQSFHYVPPAVWHQLSDAADDRIPGDLSGFVPVDGFLPKLLIRLALLPLVVGVCYELIRFAAKRPGFFMSILTAPGLWLQRITTKPPSDDQAAVAIHALDGAMSLEKACRVANWLSPENYPCNLFRSSRSWKSALKSSPTRWPIRLSSATGTAIEKSPRNRARFPK